MCHFTVAITCVGIFFETMLVSIPGHVRMCLLCIAFKNVDWNGENMLHEGIEPIQL